ncbi:IS4 family transposase, partial [Pseudomonas syringae pv. actinidiae]|nr:IS4 family transposase [Pseudomonas syringae pv. actinidiae]
TKRAPSEISFKFACQHIASHLVVMAGAVSPSHTPRRLEKLTMKGLRLARPSPREDSERLCDVAASG